MTYLSPFLVSSSEIVTDVQPSKVRLLTIPAYFINYKDETTDLAPFLGASISAKVSRRCLSLGQAFDPRGNR